MRVESVMRCYEQDAYKASEASLISSVYKILPTRAVLTLAKKIASE
jgi:hypothetical protein